MRALLLLFAFVALTGCSTIQELYDDYPKQVATMEVGLATAEHTALIYVSLPVCGKTSAVLCRTPAMTQKIGAYDMAAYTAVTAARQAEDETSVAAAQTAVAAYQQIVSGLSVGVKQ